MATLIYPRLNEFIKIASSADTTKFPARDTTLLYTYLKRALSFNLKMFGHYLTRKAALSSFGFSLVAEEEPDQVKADEAKLRLKDVILKLLNVQLNTVAFGSLLVELDIQTVTPSPGKESGKSEAANKISIRKVYENTEYDYDYPSVYIYKNGKKSDGYTAIDLAGNNDYLFDMAGEFPHRGGLLRSAMPIEILRFEMMIENANYLKKLKGLLQIVNKGGTKEDEAAAEEAAANVIKENFFISSDAIEMKLNEITNSQGYLSFRGFTEGIDAAIAIGWLGNANTSELPKYTGSRAALQVQRLISADIFYSDMNRVESFIDKLLLIDYRLHYNANATMSDLPYKFLFNLSEEQDIEKNATALETISRFMPVREDEAYKFVGFTPPQEGEKTLQVIPQIGY